MLAELKHTMSRMRGQIIGWSFGLILYILLMVYFYDSMAGMENLWEFIQSYPEEMLAFFKGITELNTPKGYLDTYYFGYMTLIVGILAIGTGAGLLVGDEERGILDLVLAHPISRTVIFCARLLGLVIALAIILLVNWLGWVIPSGSVGLNLSWIEFLRPFLPLFAVLLLFGTLALLLSMLLPSGRMAGMISGALLVANFLLLGLANINEELKPVVKFTPLYYYQGGDAVTGLNWGWLGGLLAMSVLFALLAWLLFRRRDIRVGGERSWRLPSLKAALRRS
ncbi:MAG: ABC transporter permease subunit [Anaerolineae bacterium]|nr:ABC transporter permease subunit [Anaerolineae bacterium]